MRVLDLFAGAGGFSLGFQMAGYEIIGAIEINKRYTETHDFNFKKSKSIAGDIREWPPEKFSEVTGIKAGDVDIIIGGPPCQTFSTIGASKINSVSGNKLNEDPRNYLYLNYFKYVEFFKPKIFVMENVPTMKSKYKGHLFENLLSEIHKLKYKSYNKILNAVNYGVPQTRKRLFVVGFDAEHVDYTFPANTHYLPDDLPDEKLQKFNTVSDALGDLPIIFDGIRAGEMPYSINSPSSGYQKIMRNGNLSVSNNVCRMSNTRAKQIFQHMKQGDRYMDLPSETRQILPFREDIFKDRLKRLVLDKPSWTVLAHIGMDGYMYIHPVENRTLSVREAARLQSFKDDFIFLGNMREQYVQVGNSVPPLLAKALAESLKDYL